MELLASSFRLLGDPARLRILRLLSREELNAGELTGILGMGQPTVSRHLGLLREAGLLDERREGRFVFFSLAPRATAVDGSWTWVLEQLEAEEDDAGDLARLDDVLRARRERETAGADGSGTAPFVPGRSWRAWSRGLSWFVPRGLRVVDLGCGDGALTLEIARFADRVVGVDLNAALVKRARRFARGKDARHVMFERHDMNRTRLRARSFDLAVLSQALHEAEHPEKTLAEAFRLLRPGGSVMLLDLLPHREDWARERLGHHHLGFAPVRLTELLTDAGFERVEVERMPARAGDPFKVVIARGVRR